MMPKIKILKTKEDNRRERTAVTSMTPAMVLAAAQAAVLMKRSAAGRTAMLATVAAARRTTMLAAALGVLPAVVPLAAAQAMMSAMTSTMM